MTRPRRDPDLVRSYVRTGGRSRPSRELDLVTIVVAAGHILPQGARPEARRVREVCNNGALSIAEIAAYLDLPPSVVKIVVSDLLDHECLAIPVPTNVPQLAILKEVLDGLRALPA
ncbi:DUF742 domain-containing protein [Nocardia goodfellowii]|uniref:DUF742 domain-containing protein n=1 Tax=Nocardia goodfellowii TaxID=882446 RepID=A0ABS4QMB7_9NOCA|nr:DUF742 domain-containing protein [Nocardia goodfellowii]MBP2192847.1 hypothetical protein [Nocardia goodfellowii]